MPSPDPTLNPYNPNMLQTGMMFTLRPRGVYEGVLPEDAECIFRVLEVDYEYEAIYGIVTRDPGSKLVERPIAIHFNIWPQVVIRPLLH